MPIRENNSIGSRWIVRSTMRGFTGLPIFHFVGIATLTGKYLINDYIVQFSNFNFALLKKKILVRYTDNLKIPITILYDQQAKDNK